MRVSHDISALLHTSIPQHEIKFVNMQLERGGGAGNTHPTPPCCAYWPPFEFSHMPREFALVSFYLRTHRRAISRVCSSRLCEIFGFSSANRKLFRRETRRVDK